MSDEIDVKRLVVFFIKFVLAGLIAYSLPEEAIEDENFSNTLITIFSVFSGFMIALMALTSHLNDTMSWKEIAVSKKQIEAKLLRQELLFYSYLLTLTLIVAALISEYYTLWGHSEIVSVILKRAYTFMGILSLFISFSLPRSLRKGHEKAVRDKMKSAKCKK